MGRDKRRKDATPFESGIQIPDGSIPETLKVIRVGLEATASDVLRTLYSVTLQP